MKQPIIFSLAVAFSLFLAIPEASAQGTPKPANAAKGSGKAECDGCGTTQCGTCGHAQPAQIYSSNKNSVTIYGPPDSKGEAVEYQVFSQSKSTGEWKLEVAGKVSKPGETASYKYSQPAQLLVLIYCKTPFLDMASFSNVKFPVVTKQGNDSKQ